MAEAMVVVMRSANGEDGWEPVKPEDVPDWVKEPDCMGRLVAGDMAQGPAEGLLVPDEVRAWYRAEIVPTIQ